MTLKYNEEVERYNNFNCGETFKIKIDDKYITVRIELDAKGWYLIDEYGFTKRCKSLEGLEIQEI